MTPPDPSDPPRLHADAIEGYRLGERIGEGGMATVYRARHLALDREVALKVLHPSFSSNPEYVARFLREARAAARIEHQNVVRIQDAGESRGRHFIAMELVEGRNLQTIVDRDGPLSELATLEVLEGMTRALDAAHREGMVHRDVKPANIVRTPDGRVKLLDMGLARAARHTDQDGFVTDHGKTLGTPFYFSPEQARGKDLDIRSDLYSLGVTAFHLVTGAPPYTGTSAPDVMRRHILDPVPSARVLKPSLSPTFDQVLQKLMAKDPARRYASPRELLDALAIVRGAGAEADGADDGDDARGRGRGRKEPRARKEREPKEPRELREPREPREPRPPLPPRERAEIPLPSPLVDRLVRGVLGMAILYAALLAVRLSLPPLASAAGPEARSEKGDPLANPLAEEEKAARLARDLELARARVQELSEGDPQGALLHLARAFPPERRSGPHRAELERLEAGIRRGVEARFQADLENAERQRKEGHWKIAERIYQKVSQYGGAAEKARAEQELVKLEAESLAADAAKAARVSGADEKEAFRALLLEIAPEVRRGRYDIAGERMRAVGLALSKETAMGELALEGAKLVQELSLLEALVEVAFSEMIGSNVEVTLATGTTLRGAVARADRGGKVTLSTADGPVVFQTRELPPAEKERMAAIARGGGGDLERLLVIHELYRGERAAALARAERLGSPGLVEHVRAVLEGAPPDASGAAGSSTSAAATPSAGASATGPAPPPTPASPTHTAGPAPSSGSSSGGSTAASSGPARPASGPGAPPGPASPPAAASKLEQALRKHLLVPAIQCDGDRSFELRYGFLPGAEETLKDWRAERLPFKQGLTQRGLTVECVGKAAARYVLKVPCVEPITLELVLRVDEKSASSRVVLAFAEGRGGSSYAIDCGVGLYRRARGEIVETVRKPAGNASDALRVGADIPLRLHLANGEVTVDMGGKRTLDRARVKETDGQLAIELSDVKVAMRELVVKAGPDPLWLLEEIKDRKK